MEWPSRLPVWVSDSKPTAHPAELFGKDREEPRSPTPYPPTPPPLPGPTHTSLVCFS